MKFFQYLLKIYYAIGKRLNRIKITLLIFVISLNIFCISGFYWVNHQRPTGDEPHYLIIAESLLKDHDLDLKNNYNNKDYQKWGYPGITLDRHISANSQGNFQFSFHNFGWPLLFLPGFALGGRNGAVLISLLIAALLATNIFLFTREHGRKTATSIAVYLSFSFSLPILIYASQLFNEIAAALLIFYTFRKILKPYKNWFLNILPVLTISYLPFIHAKYFWVSLILAALYFWTFFKKKELYWLIIYLGSLICFGIFFKHLYGSYLPNAQYQDHFNLNFLNIAKGGFGLFFDQALGLLPYSPIYFLILPASIVLFKKNKKMLLSLWLTFLSVFVLAAFAATNVGWSPFGRFLLPVILLFSGPIAYLYEQGKTFTKVAFYIFSLWGWLMGILLVKHPDLAYSIGPPKFWQFLSSKLIDFTKVFPKIIDVEKFPQINQLSHNLTIFWCIFLALFTLISVYDARKG